MKIYARDLLTKTQPRREFPVGFNLNDHVREIGVQANGHRIYEFVGTGDFGAAWQERQRYEVNAGRDEEPQLFQSIYNIINDPSLPKNVDINKIGPGGVVFEEVLEGGEVKFASVTSSEATVRIRHYGQGLEYSKDMVVFNELFRVPLVERQVGIAFNALLNHIAFDPILSFAYTAANQTAFNDTGVTTVEDYLLTIEDAVTNSRTDTANPRRGPYVLLCSSSDLFTIEKALTQEVVQGLATQSQTVRNAIRAVVAYDGWTGTRGNLSTTYAGVPAQTAYLISLQYAASDFQFYMKQDLMQDGTDEDASRFMTQVIWDTYFGAYANPEGAVEEISFS